LFQNMVLKHIFETKVKVVTTYLTKFNNILWKQGKSQQKEITPTRRRNTANLSTYLQSELPWLTCICLKNSLIFPKFTTANLNRPGFLPLWC
jgi:hypothetical protein